jgi:MFS family permease
LQHAPREKVISPTFLLVTFATFAYFLAVGAIIPTLPRYVEGPLNSGSVAVGLAMGAFALTAVVLRPLVGRISDTRGRRILIIFGGTIVGATIVGYAVTQSMPGLIVLRLLTGVGEAGFYVGVASVINDLAPESRRGEAISYFSLALFLGLALGPVVGESTLEAAGFDEVWFIAGTSAVIAGLVGIFVPDTRPPDAATASDAPLLNRAAIKPGTVLATHIWSLATFSSFVPLYALSLGLSGSRFVFALHSVLILAIRLFGARLPDRLGPRRAAVFALTFTATGLAIMAGWASPPGLYLGAVAFSFGHALAFPALMTLAIRGAPAA